MRMLGMVSLAFAFLAVVTAQGADEAAQKKGKADLEGMWKIISVETAQGKDANAEGAILEFDKDGKNLTYTVQNKMKEGTFTLNLAAKPKEIDIKPMDEDKTFEGIYHVDKNMLKICLAPEAGDGRPSEFATKDGKSFVLIMLERAK